MCLTPVYLSLLLKEILSSSPVHLQTKPKPTTTPFRCHQWTSRFGTTSSRRPDLRRNFSVTNFPDGFEFLLYSLSASSQLPLAPCFFFLKRTHTVAAEGTKVIYPARRGPTATHPLARRRQLFWSIQFVQNLFSSAPCAVAKGHKLTLYQVFVHSCERRYASDYVIQWLWCTKSTIYLPTVH